MSVLYNILYTNKTAMPRELNVFLFTVLLKNDHKIQQADFTMTIYCKQHNPIY